VKLNRTPGVLSAAPNVGIPLFSHKLRTRRRSSGASVSLSNQNRQATSPPMKPTLPLLFAVTGLLGSAWAVAQDSQQPPSTPGNPPATASPPAPPAASSPAPQEPHPWRHARPEAGGPDGQQSPDGEHQWQRHERFQHFGGERPDGAPRGDGPGREQQPQRPAPKPAPYIGVVTSSVPPLLASQLGLAESFGLVVDSVLPNSPAATAGLQKFDVLKLYNDQQIINPQQLQVLARATGKDGSATITVIRKGQEQKVSVKIAEGVIPALLASAHHPGEGERGFGHSAMGHQSFGEGGFGHHGFDQQRLSHEGVDHHGFWGEGHRHHGFGGNQFDGFGRGGFGHHGFHHHDFSGRGFGEHGFGDGQFWHHDFASRGFEQGGFGHHGFHHHHFWGRGFGAESFGRQEFRHHHFDRDGEGHGGYGNHEQPADRAGRQHGPQGPGDGQRQHNFQPRPDGWFHRPSSDIDPIPAEPRNATGDAEPGNLNDKLSFSDETGQIEIRTQDGHRMLLATGAEGETLFDGPIDTAEQRDSVPEDIARKIDSLESQTPVPAAPSPDLADAEAF